MRLSGKVALVTGAASGIGRETALLFAREGASRIIAIDRPGGDLDAVAEGIRSAGAAPTALELDVTDFESLSGALTEIGAPLDALVVNAGIVRQGTVLESTPESWQSQIDINLTGAWNTIRASLPHMLAHGRGGSITVTASVSGLRGSAGFAGYIASKHGVVGLAHALANEVGDDWIRVNSVAPTAVATPMADQEGRIGEEGDLKRSRYRDRHLLPVDEVQPIDVARAIAWLSSDEARYVTGIELPIDAGSLAKQIDVS